MTSDEAAARRRRSSTDSRARLLEAARDLFAEHGYERTTVRDIGRAAGLDPTLIARYFGGKAALYLEALRPAGHVRGAEPPDLTDPEAVGAMLERHAPSAAPTPALQAAIRPHDNPEIQEAAMSVLLTRLVEPLEARARDAGLDRPRLRAETAAAALAGIMISRSSKALETLTAAPSEDLAELVASLIRDVLND
ncbi:helix-turn-helix domain-containing protein [Streptomyces sp. NPDC056600]|uniref:helix-turn-helix domain-containing protein n=1 Tax=Streptomyces sp. NPDC056600 TaxID=3345874 RepID=UPI0036912536